MGRRGKAIRPQLRLAYSPAPPPLTPSQASPASRRSSVCEEVKDAKVEDGKVEDAKDGEDKEGEDAEDETLNTPPQDAPASLLAAFSEEADEADAGCAERVGALGRAEAGGAEWAWRAEGGKDAGEEVKARGPRALLLRDVDLRGLEFSEQVGPSLQQPPHPPLHKRIHRRSSLPPSLPPSLPLLPPPLPIPLPPSASLSRSFLSIPPSLLACVCARLCQ